MSKKNLYGSPVSVCCDYSWSFVSDFLGMLDCSFCCISEDSVFRAKLLDLLAYCEDKACKRSFDILDDLYVVKTGRDYLENDSLACDAAEVV